jgi:hypothetical protein
MLFPSESLWFCLFRAHYLVEQVKFSACKTSPSPRYLATLGATPVLNFKPYRCVGPCSRWFSPTAHRFEQRVVEAEDQDVLHCLLAKIVVDSVDRFQRFEPKLLSTSRLGSILHEI